MGVKAICVILAWITIRVIVREIIVVGPSVCFVPAVGMFAVAFIIQFEVDVVVVWIAEADALLLVPRQQARNLVHIIVIRESAVRPACGMIRLEGLSDLGSLFGLEFFGSS